MGSLRILAADDAPVMRRLLRATLETQLGHQIVTMLSDGNDVAQHVREQSFDFAVLDLEMPRCDGLTALAQIRKSAPELPVVLLTAATGNFHRAAQRAHELGAMAFLPKPSSRKGVNESIQLLATALQRTIAQITPRETATPNLHALVVDDSPTNQKILGRILQTWNHRVDTARNGIEAEHIWQFRSPDVVFMDCEMPQMDGYTASRRLRQHETDGRRNQAVIVGISGSNDSTTREKCLDAGMTSFLPKPFNRDRTRALLDEHFAAPEVARHG